MGGCSCSIAPERQASSSTGAPASCCFSAVNFAAGLRVGRRWTPPFPCGHSIRPLARNPGCAGCSQWTSGCQSSLQWAATARMAPSRCSKRAMGGGMTRQQQGRSHCHSGACTCDGLFSRSSHAAEATDPFMFNLLGHSRCSTAVANLDSFKSCQQSVPNPRISQLPGPGPGPPSMSIWTVNKEALPHRRRCSSARLRDRQFDSDIAQLRPLSLFVGEQSRDGKRPRLLRLPWQRRLAGGAVGLIPSTSARPAYESLDLLATVAIVPSWAPGFCWRRTDSLDVGPATNRVVAVGQRTRPRRS